MVSGTCLFLNLSRFSRLLVCISSIFYMETRSDVCRPCVKARGPAGPCSERHHNRHGGVLDCQLEPLRIASLTAMSFNPYLGEEPPADAYASMNVDDEYEGGQWVDGEFYYQQKKTRPQRAQSKAEAIYGVWAEDADDEEDNERRAAKQSKRRDEELIKDDEQPEEEVEAAAGGRRGLGLGASASQRKEGRQGRRQAASEGSSLLGRTMKFVASSSPTPQPPTDNEPPSTAQPAPPTVSSPAATTAASASASVSESISTTTLSFKRRRLAQQAEINRQKQPDPPQANTTASAAPTQPRPFRPPTVDAEYAAFTQHSSPAVLLMMERMGFRGRLGKHETGVALPILPQLRPKGVGLGGVKEKVQRVGRNADEEEKIEQEKREEKERKKKDNTNTRATTASAGGGAREKAWKRGERKGKTVYKTAHEVIREHSQHPSPASTSTTTPTVIIDMTGATPVQKQLSSLSSSSSVDKPSASQPSACPELVHNVQLLCDLCENEILDVEKQIERLRLDIDTMERDEARMKVRARKEQEAEQRLQAVIAEVSEVERRMKQAEADGESVNKRLSMVEQFYHRLQRQWTREWRMYGLVRVVAVLLLPLLREVAGQWTPSALKVEEADKGGELFDELKRWRVLLEESTSSVYYDDLVDILLLPPLRLALSSASLPLQQPILIVPLLQQLRAVLPDRVYSSVVSSLLLPRLHRLLGAYNPRAMSAPYWLLSYAEVLSAEELHLLAGVVRHRLQLTMGGWKVEDEVEDRQQPVERDADVREMGGAEERMVDRVAGWKGVWKEEEMDAFLSRYIQPRLLAAITGLRSTVTSTPLSSLPLVSAVLAWSALFSPLAFTPLISAVLSHFLSTLYGLLSQPEPDFEQASDVYEQWKDALPAHVAVQRSMVDEASKRALAMMNAAMEDSDVSSIYRDAMLWIRQFAKPSSLPAGTRSAGERPMGSAGRPRPAAVAEDRAGRSMRDVLYAFGNQHGFDVYPHGRRTVSNHDVYWFGAVQVYWSGDDVYAMDERSKEWEMVSLSQLLQLAKQAQARGRT